MSWRSIAGIFNSNGRIPALMAAGGAGRPLAFLEYVPGEFAWRRVDARGWLFVHCLWVYPAGQKVEWRPNMV